MRKNKGITLISLVITIIVLLIISSISISMLNGNNSIIKNAGNAKVNSEIAKEKEIVEKSTVQAKGKSKYGNLAKTDLTEKLNLYAGEEKTEVIEDGENFVVRFIDTNRYYQVSIDGDVEPIEVVVDQYAGDITKNNEYDGDTLESAYRISCIEDLVSFSNMSINDTFSNKYIVLTRNLDFKSRLSYNNYNTQEFGDINNDGIVKGLMEEMTLETGIGFKPIGNAASHFGGIFASIDDNIKVIKNMYQNTSYGGLFANTENAKIQNIGLTGKIISTVYSGGLVYTDNSNTQIINCFNSCSIQAGDGNTNNTGTGGIIGTLSSTGKVENCYNTGNISGNAIEGGIVGSSSGTVKNCYNSGIITSTNSKTYTGTGGIVGYSNKGSSSKIINCFNLKSGAVHGEKVSGGIIGQVGRTDTLQIQIINCYNLAQISGGGSGGLIGIISASSTTSSTEVNVINCYNLGEISSGEYIGGILGQIWASKGTITASFSNVFNGGIVSTNSTKSGEIVGRRVNGTLNFSNCYYLNTNTNSAIGSGTATSGTAVSASVDGISTLNTFVTNYNVQNTNNENFEELKTWGKNKDEFEILYFIE